MNDLVSVIIPTRNRKTDTVQCVRSIIASTHTNIEIIVIDNNSSDGTADAIKKSFRDVEIVCNKSNLMAAQARNIGASIAKGQHLLFVDSDNVVCKDMVSQLLGLAHKDPANAFIGPKMYYFSEKKRIWYAGADINNFTAKTTYRGLDQIDNGQFDDIRETGHIPNVFLVKRGVFDEIGGFDEDYVMSYSESDLPLKAKKLGYKVLYCPKAVTYHKKSRENHLLKDAGTDAQKRVYYLSRNRSLYMKKNAPISNVLLFTLAFFPFYSTAFLFYFLAKGKMLFLKAHIIGSLHGFKYLLTGELIDYY